MLVKIVTLGLVGTLLAVILKKHSKELMPFFEIALLISALMLIVDELKEVSATLKNLFSYSGISQDLLSCLVKGAAITVLTKLTCELCRENGNSLMGEVVELGGRIMLIVLSLPYISDVITVALSFVK